MVNDVRKIRFRPKDFVPCQICQSDEEVIVSTVWWSTWGRNSFDFNWQKHEGEVALCRECEEENWQVCEDCGALVPSDDEGKGYLPEDWFQEYLCPECAEKRGFEIRVGIGSPPWANSARPVRTSPQLEKADD